MKRIVLKKGSRGEMLLKEMIKRNAEAKKEMIDSAPPIEITTYIKDFTEKTFDLNKGTLNKESFRLGMYAMWYHMNKKK